jgi:cyclopropane-fatty-acyl-phospholipid synthase
VINVSSKIWEYFLAASTITSRQGGATCWQLTLVKNINSTHRVEGIQTQFALSGARQAAIEKVGHGSVPSAHVPAKE